MTYFLFYSGVYYNYILIEYVYYERIKYTDAQVDMYKSRQN